MREVHDEQVPPLPLSRFVIHTRQTVKRLCVCGRLLLFDRVERGFCLCIEREGMGRWSLGWKALCLQR